MIISLHPVVTALSVILYQGKLAKRNGLKSLEND